MATTFLEAGTAATFGLEFWTAFGGFGEASEATIVHTGPRSLKLPNYGSVRKDSVCQDSGTRVTFYVYFSALPPSSLDFCRVNSTTTGKQIEIRLLSTGILRLQDGNSNTFDGTTVLATATWYRISLAYTITNATTNEFRLFLNGALERSVSNTTTGVGTGTVQWFLEQSGGGSGVTIYVSDTYTDDSPALTDPGDIRVTDKLPVANNVNDFDSFIPGGANPANRWTNVNERPLSETNGWQQAGSSQVRENFGLEAAAAGDVDVSGATLVARCAWMWAKAAATSGTPKITDNGSDFAVTLTSTSALFTHLTTSASYPSNSAGIGLVSTGTADDTFLYECGMLLAYTAGTAPDLAPGTLLITWP